jgi:Rab-GTPase-TBC domain
VLNVNQRSLTSGLCRKLAWCLFLNITEQQILTKEYKAYLKDVADNKGDQAIRRQISADLFRTFIDNQIPQIRAPKENGKNPLFNVLMAFSLHYPQIGYAQGMNYLVAMILIGVEMNEDYAFTILVHLLTYPGEDNFKLESLFDTNLSGTHSLSTSIEEWLKQSHPEIAEYLEQFHMRLGFMLSGPFMTFFSNKLDLLNSMHVLDRTILLGS